VRRLGRDEKEAAIPLRLATSGDPRAIEIRDHVLPIVREHGTLRDLEDKDSTLRLTILERGTWVITHWTPFNALSPTEASSPAYRHAVERQHTRPDLAYGLDIETSDRHVLGVMWSDDGIVNVTTFIRGEWEDAALAM
jgi:hypothetical protein